MAQTQKAFPANILPSKKRLPHLFGLLPWLSFITVIWIYTRICSHIPHLLLMITKWRHNAEFITSHSLALQQSLVKITELWPPCGIKQRRKGNGKENAIIRHKKCCQMHKKKEFSLKRRLALHSTPIARYMFVWWLIHMVFLDHNANTIKYHVARMNKD